MFSPLTEIPRLCPTLCLHVFMNFYAIVTTQIMDLNDVHLENGNIYMKEVISFLLRS